MAGKSGIEKINIPDKLGAQWTQQEAEAMHILLQKISSKFNELIAKSDDHETRIEDLGG